MSDSSADSSTTLRRSIYGLLIAAAVGACIGRIFAVQSPDGKSVMLCANDRSRWCAVRALVDQGTFWIDDVIQQPGWDTIDKVRHTGHDGVPHYYSSKPPFLPVLLAGQYSVIKTLSGATLAEHPFYVGRVLLIVTNVLPLLVYWLLLAHLVEQWGRTQWGRVYVMVAATCGTFLTTFAVTINNHLPAAVAVLIAVYAASRIWHDGQRGVAYFALAGLAAAFAAACELPALAFLALLATGLLWKAPRQTLIGFVPGVAVVAAMFFVPNHLAHDSWRPPYAHRQPGDNWYDYEGSYWRSENRQGIDRGEPSRPVYATHVTVGHHGILSLTPIWLLSACGVAMMLRRRQRRAFALFVTALTLICLLFYLFRPLQDRNYGGVTSGFRWMFWFTPLWLLAMIPALDAAASRRSYRLLAVVMLGVSAISASYSALNPWTHPWIYQYWQSLGWVPP